MTLDKGDVVFGYFPCADGKTLVNHYSVVMAVDAGRALLVFTTSAKREASRLDSLTGGWFNPQDKMLAGWSQDCRYDAAKLATVPLSKLRRTGRVSAATVQAIQQKVTKASANQRATGFRVTHYDPKAEEVCV